MTNVDIISCFNISKPFVKLPMNFYSSIFFIWKFFWSFTWLQITVSSGIFFCWPWVLLFAADFDRKWPFSFYIQERHIKVYLWPLSTPAFFSKLCRIYTNFIPFSCFRCFAASTKTPWSRFLLDPVLWSACGPGSGQWTVQLLGTSAATNPSTDRLITERSLDHRLRPGIHLNPLNRMTLYERLWCSEVGLSVFLV